MSEIQHLEPTAIWKNFHAINLVPRPSKKEEKIREFIISFAENLGLKVETDEVGNVIVRKSAYPGMEDRKPVILQSHLDMVCQKNNDIDFDFETQGIQTYIAPDGFVKAKGTTLGADNGIGVAAILGILEAKNIPHPPIEAFFTIDEETGMTGALGLKGGILKGKILLNLDTEQDNELNIGCAGGIDVTAEKSYSKVKLSGDHKFIKLYIKGLKGGHSGMEIHKGLGNSNKLLSRFLVSALNFNAGLININGGGLRNAIPRETYAELAVPTEKYEEFFEAYEKLKAEIIDEFRTIEENLNIEISETESASEALSKGDFQAVANSLLIAHNGVFRMSPDVPGLVETSNNVARVELIDGKIRILCLTRSSVESGKEFLAQTLKSTFELSGFSVGFSGDYPGWKVNTQSEILELMKSIYTEKFGEEPAVVACHAGLECGIIGRNYPGLDMISFGPNIFGAHSPDERVEIKSVRKFRDLLLTTLGKIPENEFVDYSC